MNPELIAAACLVVLAVAHSVLGEAGILRPMFAADWSIEVPRWATERILRFAWHLTSIAWLAMAGVVVGGDPLPMVAIMSLWSAAVIFVMLRGHMAWPLFLLAGLAALRADDVLDSPWMRAGAIGTAAVLVLVAAVHVYWALGGRWMHDRALPGGYGDVARYDPGRALTLAVAVLLGAFAAVVVAVAADRGPSALRWLVAIGVGALVVRAIGDRKDAGFTKTIRETEFARADDRWFTPLVVFLALGSTGALLV